MMNQVVVALHEIKSIQAFLSTYKPEHGREFIYTLIPPIKLDAAHEPVSGKMKEYESDNLRLDISVNQDDDHVSQIIVRVTTVGKNRVPIFYVGVRNYLDTHLCEPLRKNPAALEKIVQSLIE